MTYPAAPNQCGSAPRIHLELDARAEAPADARGALEPLRGVLGRECIEVVELVLSELVTNAVRHSRARRGGPVEVEVDCGQSTVRVAVTDPGPGFDPAQRGGPRGAAGGWGLYVVGEIADRWWVERGDDGTRVVAELTR